MKPIKENEERALRYLLAMAEGAGWSTRSGVNPVEIAHEMGMSDAEADDFERHLYDRYDAFDVMADEMVTLSQRGLDIAHEFEERLQQEGKAAASPPVQPAPASEDDVLSQLAKAIESAGWFPGQDDFIDRGNRVAVDALIKKGLVTDALQGPFLCPRAQALRRIRDKVPFARNEVERAAELLRFLQDKMVRPKVGPQSMDAIATALKWADSNQARRATFLLWMETGAKGIEVTFGSNNVPSAVAANRYIWDAKPEDLLHDPVPAVAAGAPPDDLATLAVQQAIDAMTRPTQAKPASRRVFIVHGHDEAAKLKVVRVLEKLNLEGVILHEQPNRGRTLIEKFEAHAEDVAFAIAIATPDDVGAAKGKKPRPRARENVLFEAGYFAGALGRGYVVLLRKPGVELPSDLHGVVYIEMDDGDGWVMKLVKELEAAGIEVDSNLLTKSERPEPQRRAAGPRRPIREPPKPEADPHKRAAEAEARKLFAAICSMVPVDVRGSHHHEAQDKAAELYAVLGTNATARYITSAAMAFFVYGRYPADTGRMAALEQERQAVERHLADPDAPWDVARSGAVRDWAKGAHQSEGWKGMPWLLRDDD